MTQARHVVSAIAFFIASSVTHPWAQALRGPRRVSASSEPFTKSKKSLIRFASICIAKEKSRHSSAAVHENTSPSYILASCQASAAPIITGTAAPDSVFGRAASSHAFSELVLIIASSIVLFFNLYAKVQKIFE